MFQSISFPITSIYIKSFFELIGCVILFKAKKYWTQISRKISTSLLHQILLQNYVKCFGILLQSSHRYAKQKSKMGCVRYSGSI